MSREIYVTDEEYYLCPIIDEDRNDFVNLKRQVNGEETMFAHPLVKEDMWESIMEGSTICLSIIDSNGEYCGNLEVQDPESTTPEIGIELVESKRNKGIAIKVIKMVMKRYSRDHEVDYYIARVVSKNTHSIHMIEKLGGALIRKEASLYESIIEGMEKTMHPEEVNRFKEFLKGSLKEEEICVYKL